MARFGFVGPSYQSQSLNADAQRCLNWYPESIESGQGKSAMALYPTPGLAQFAQIVPGVPAGGVRGAISINGRAFFVAGTLFTEVSSTGQLVAGNSGNVANDGLPVSMAASPTQILIASGGVPYVYNLSNNTLTNISSTLTGITVSSVGFCDGFFLALQANSQQFFVSSPEDATTWDLSNTAIVSVFPDNVLAMLVDHREIWLWGASKSVVYYDSGNIFPFDVVPGAYIEQGIGAPASAVRLDNSVFWLGSDDRGTGIGWRSNSYSPVRISNHAVETAWQSYPTIADAIGYSYQDQGHSFWVLYFPTANKTWVYDVATQMWHERSFRAGGSAVDTAHRSRCHVYAFGKHLVGDWAGANVYQMAIPQQNGVGWSFANDFGNPIRRVRRAPHVSTEQEWVFHHELQVDVEAGLGPQPPLTQAAPYPVTITLQDPNGVLWNVSVSDAGAIQTAHGGSAAQVILLNDITIADQSWQLGISTGGVLEISSDAFSSLNPGTYPMATSATQLLSGLQVNAGAVQTVPPMPYPRDPQLLLRWSDDGGKTWSNERILNCGQAGQFRKRVIARRLGRSRDRIYELAATDPIPWRIVDAYLRATPGFEPVERISKNLGKMA